MIRAIALIERLPGHLRVNRIRQALQPLLSDTEEALVYEGGNFTRREVKAEVEKLLSQLEHPHR